MGEEDHHAIPKAVNININSKEEAGRKLSKGEWTTGSQADGYAPPNKTSPPADMDATETTRSTTPDPSSSSYEDEDIQSLVSVDSSNKNKLNDGQRYSGQQSSEPELFCELRDVLIVVGGQNFWEHSTLLRCCSEYFDEAMSMMGGNNDEGNELRFDFPDKRAEEWKLVQELMQPYSREQISMTNMQQLLPWLDTLRIRRGLDQCDHVLCEELGSKSLRALELANKRKNQNNNNNKKNNNVSNDDSSSRQQLQELHEYLDLMLEGLVTSSQYNLRASKGMLLGIIGRIVQDHSILLSKKDCESIGYLMSTDEECRYQLWEKISMYLPSNFPKDADSAVLMIDTQPEVFQTSLYNGIQAQKSLDDLNWLEKKALRWLQNRSHRRQQQQQQQNEIVNNKKKKDKEGKVQDERNQQDD